MTDQPAPPAEKKPRRRGPPRKRTGKRAEASAPANEVRSDDAASAPEAVAERLDPAPLADPGGRGDAPATDRPEHATPRSRRTAATEAASAEATTHRETAPEDAGVPGATGADAGDATSAQAHPQGTHSSGPLQGGGDQGSLASGPARGSPLSTPPGQDTSHPRRRSDRTDGGSGTAEAAAVPDGRASDADGDAHRRADRSTPQARDRPPSPERTGRGEPQRPPKATTAQTAPRADAPGRDGLRPLVRVPLSVRWRDLDAFNHVNNSKYLSYLEEARLRWMLAIPGMGLDEHVAPVVAASNLNYRRPIGWPADVVVELYVERVGSSSVTIAHRIVDANDGAAVYCDGNVVMVWIDRESGRAASLPESVRSACG